MHNQILECYLPMTSDVEGVQLTRNSADGQTGATTIYPNFLYKVPV